jgi:hypothetical protein
MVDAIRQIGVSEVTYYRWRQEFGGLKRVSGYQGVCTFAKPLAGLAMSRNSYGAARGLRSISVGCSNNFSTR